MLLSIGRCKTQAQPLRYIATVWAPLRNGTKHIAIYIGMDMIAHKKANRLILSRFVIITPCPMCVNKAIEKMINSGMAE